MKRLIAYLFLGLSLLSCNNKATLPAELRMKLEYLGGSRARFTVVASSQSAYYSYLLVNERDDDFHKEDAILANEEIERMDESYQYFGKIGIEANYLDAFCYRGSRQISLSSLTNDLSFRLIIFQIHPRTHKLIGEPVSVPFRTKRISKSDMTFSVTFAGDELTITPSNNEETYFWDYENSSFIVNVYALPYLYFYRLVGMYQEYGFLENMLSQGTDKWIFSLMDKEIKEGEELILMIAPVENGEFTRNPLEIHFTYHKGDIEVTEYLEPEDDDDWEEE